MLILPWPYGARSALIKSAKRKQYNQPLYLVPDAEYKTGNKVYNNRHSIQSEPMMIREHKWSVHGPLCGKTASVTLHYRT